MGMVLIQQKLIYTSGQSMDIGLLTHILKNFNLSGIYEMDQINFR